ncbi:hypothetical protein BGX28_000754 [Mortierella sp. GBA30]|nr:hypothetical protein BGX28_000754 [Mortierella sp. GBA30]
MQGMGRGAAPPPGHMPPPMYGAPPPHLQQSYPPPPGLGQHHQPQFQGRGGPMHPQHFVPPPQHQLQHQGGPPPGAPGYPGQPPQQHRVPRPPFGSGPIPPPGSIPMVPPGYMSTPLSSTTLKAGPNGAAPGYPMTAGMLVAGGALPDKMNTLFIGAIAPGINNVAMEKLLKTTGNLTKWKRVQDPTTQLWKAFGFAEYADADSLLRTLRVLGQHGQQPKGEKPIGLELTAMDGSGTVKALVVNVDEKTRKYLDQYEESRPRTIHDTEKDKVALANATKIIQQMKDGTLDTSEQPAEDKDEESKKLTEKPDETTTAASDDIPEEQKELIARELNFFRERAALKEKEKREEEMKAERMRSSQQYKQQQDKAAAQTSSAASHRMNRDRAWGDNATSSTSTRLMDFVPASGSNHIEIGSNASVAASTGAASSSADHDSAMDSEEEEKARQERREREQDISYKERERRWEQREAERMRMYEKDRVRDEDYIAEVHAAKEAMSHRFATWNDDVERERRHEEYYRDRSRWWERRLAFLRKEERYDDLDREEEKAELEQERETAVKKAQADAEAIAVAEAAASAGAAVLQNGDTDISTTTAESATDKSDTVTAGADVLGTASSVLPNQPTKLKLSLGTTTTALKRGLEAGGGPGSASGPSSTSAFLAANEFEQDEDEKETKKRRVLVPVKYSDDESDETDKTNANTVDKEKKTEEIKALIQSIPAEAQGLWNWSIQWQYVSEDKNDLLKDKIRPFAAKKIFELLDDKEDDLTDFIIDHIRQRKPPQELVTELRGALDNDADVLVMKIWRMLIFETESRARNL